MHPMVLKLMDRTIAIFSSPLPFAWLDAVEDAQLDAYEREVARDPENALKPTKLTSNGGVLKCGAYSDDRSRYSSNDWAIYLYDTCLWSSKPPSGIY